MNLIYKKRGGIVFSWILAGRSGGIIESSGQDTYLSEVFEHPPLTVFRRQRNIRDHLIRAKVPSDPKPYPERIQRGMRNCGKNCTACPYIKVAKSLRINQDEWKINQSLPVKFPIVSI